MADYGIKITRPGYDAKTDNDERHMSLWTKYKLYKIETSGNGTVSGSGPVTFQGGRHYTLGIKDTGTSRWYMAGATGANNAGFCGMKSQVTTVFMADASVYGNVAFTWTLVFTGTNLPYFYYTTVDTI